MPLENMKWLHVLKVLYDKRKNNVHLNRNREFDSSIHLKKVEAASPPLTIGLPDTQAITALQKYPDVISRPEEMVVLAGVGRLLGLWLCW